MPPSFASPASMMTRKGKRLKFCGKPNGTPKFSREAAGNIWRREDLILHDSFPPTSTRFLSRGIRHADIEKLEQHIDRADLDRDFKDTVNEEREATQERQDDLRKQIDVLRNRLPERIRSVYVVKAKRIEPVGLVYLWPVTG